MNDTLLVINSITIAGSLTEDINCTVCDCSVDCSASHAFIVLSSFFCPLQFVVRLQRGADLILENMFNSLDILHAADLHYGGGGASLRSDPGRSFCRYDITAVHLTSPTLIPTFRCSTGD